MILISCSSVRNAVKFNSSDSCGNAVRSQYSVSASYNVQGTRNGGTILVLVESMGLNVIVLSRSWLLMFNLLTHQSS